MDIEKFKTEVADLACELASGVEGPRLDIFLEYIAKSIYGGNGFCQSSEFLEAIKQAKRMALRKIYGRERDLKSELIDYLKLTNTDTNLTTICRDLTILTKQEKGKLYTILHRLVEDTTIVRRGRGTYSLASECKFEDWTKAETKPISLWLPFELSSPDYCVLHPGDIVLFMGSPNAGKTAVTMSVAKENRRNYNVYYFSSEITAASFKNRMSKFKDCSVEQMNEIKFSGDIGTNYEDYIIPGEGNLNIIDYLELPDDYHKIGGILGRIHQKLCGSICVANLQKDPNKEVGVGGNFTQMKPMLSVALDYPNIATITKCKEWNPNIPNPNRKIYRYKLIDGCKFTRATPSVGWTTKQAGGLDHGI